VPLEGQGLRGAHVRTRGNGVPVQRRQCDEVKVNEPQPAHTAPQQHVSCVAAHALPTWWSGPVPSGDRERTESGVDAC
jgi:hypothetical protein